MTEPKDDNVRKLYKSIQSGELSFEDFKARFVDEPLVLATRQVQDLIDATELKLGYRLASRRRTPTGEMFSFDFIMTTGPYVTTVADVCILNLKYSYVNEPWMSKKRAVERLIAQVKGRCPSK